MSSQEGNYIYFFTDIVEMMGSSNQPTTGKAILESLIKNKDKGAGRNRIITNEKTFLEFIFF